jgi:hypothetical protein
MPLSHLLQRCLFIQVIQ